MSETPKFPYPGLRPFRQDEFKIFFGRDDQITRLVEKFFFRKEHFIAVVGRSGSGKSSLVRTGMLNALEIYSKNSWKIIDLSPTSSPLVSLATALLNNEIFKSSYSKIKNESIEEDLPHLLFSDLYNGTISIQEVLNKSDDNTHHFLIFIDQFEELFNRAKEKDFLELKAFVQLILHVIKEKNIYVIITMRSDFLDDCTQFYGLPETIDKGLFILPRLTHEQLIEAIEAPARLFGYQVDSELTNWLVQEMQNNIDDQLPLMQHALRTIWWHVHSKARIEKYQEDQEEKLLYIMQLKHYAEVGEKSLSKTLSIQADNAFNSLPLKQKSIAERMFRCLIDVNSQYRDIRRPSQLKEIAQFIGIEVPELIKVINVFRESERSYITPHIDNYDIYFQNSELKPETELRVYTKYKLLIIIRTIRH